MTASVKDRVIAIIADQLDVDKEGIGEVWGISMDTLSSSLPMLLSLSNSKLSALTTSSFVS